MKQYRWQAAALEQVSIVPAPVTDRYLTEATADELRVLLWFSRHAGAFDLTACAQDLGLAAEICSACMDTWIKRGVLAEATQESGSVFKYNPRPTPVKPQLREVVDYQKKHPHFSDFVQEASARLGKAIGPADTATLLYLHDTVGLPMEVILLEIAYAVSIGKGNMRYVEKVALSWADEDRVTVEAVDEYIQLLELQQQSAQQVEQWLDSPRPLTANQGIMAARWIREWDFSEEMIRKGAELTHEKIPTLSPKFFSYLDRVLDGWKQDGIDTPDKIPVISGKKTGAAATNPETSSLDLEGLDAELLRYTPVFKRKE